MITLTSDAREKLATIIESGGAPSSVRVSVVRGPHGCVHGWSLGLEGVAAPQDVVLSFDGLELLIEPELTEALDGAEIDYREDEAGIGFRIAAPNSHALGSNGGGCGNH